MQKLVQHSSIGVAVVLCKARIEVFPGRVAADRMPKGLGFMGLGFHHRGSARVFRSEDMWPVAFRLRISGVLGSLRLRVQAI